MRVFRERPKKFLRKERKMKTQLNLTPPQKYKFHSYQLDLFFLLTIFYCVIFQFVYKNETHSMSSEGAQTFALEYKYGLKRHRIIINHGLYAAVCEIDYFPRTA